MRPYPNFTASVRALHGVFGEPAGPAAATARLSRVLRFALSAVLGVLTTWLLLIVLLAASRPRGLDLGEAKRFVPDLARLLRSLSKDPSTARGVRWRLLLLLTYLASPIDLVPDFIPVLGYADDVIVVAIALRSVVRHTGPDVLDRHWSGSAVGLAIVKRLAGVRT
ncbi:MAG: DUF1232 domain-containing protein [Actinobacteria bacterium]|nr:DUF1232 domain-containing protein [Actinomycetota bacterium]